jgi:hypothetical protein
VLEVAAPSHLDRFRDAKPGVRQELEEQPPVVVELVEEPRELRAGHRLDGFVLDRLADGDADAGSGAVAQRALLDGICEEGSDDGDVVRRLKVEL